MALGQVTPGPVVQTVAVVGYAASGLWGGCWRPRWPSPPRSCSSSPARRHFDRLRTDRRVQAFFVGAGSAVIGAIAGSAIPLGLELPICGSWASWPLAAVWLLALRRGVVPALIGAGALGVVAVLAGAPS